MFFNFKRKIILKNREKIAKKIKKVAKNQKIWKFFNKM